MIGGTSSSEGSSFSTTGGYLQGDLVGGANRKDNFGIHHTVGVVFFWILPYSSSIVVATIQFGSSYIT